MSAEPSPGETWVGMGGRTVRVMAVVEGWVMARYKGAMPFCLIMREFVILYDRLEKKL